VLPSPRDVHVVRRTGKAATSPVPTLLHADVTKSGAVVLRCSRSPWVVAVWRPVKKKVELEGAKTRYANAGDASSGHETAGPDESRMAKSPPLLPLFFAQLRATGHNPAHPPPERCSTAASRRHSSAQCIPNQRLFVHVDVEAATSRCQPTRTFLAEPSLPESCLS